MKRYAEVFNGMVRCVFEVDDTCTPESDGTVSFVQVDETVQPGWMQSAEGFYDPPVTDMNICVHLSMAGGDGLPKIGIEVTNSTHDITGSAIFRMGVDPTSDVVPISDHWRVPIRKSDGTIYDVVGITFTNGEANFVYPVARAVARGPAMCSFNQQDFANTVMGDITYHFVLVGDCEFAVYEDL